VTLAVDAARTAVEFSYRATDHARSRCPWHHENHEAELSEYEQLGVGRSPCDASTYVQAVPIDSSKIRRQSGPMALSHRIASCIF
jgi:hypothetical protein